MLQPNRQSLHQPRLISDILTIDETVKSNPEAMFNLCKGALNAGYREFTANVAAALAVRAETDQKAAPSNCPGQYSNAEGQL